MSLPSLPLKAVLVGCGGRGRSHIASVIKYDDIEFIAICDPSTEILDSTGDEFNIANRYSDVEALLQTENIDVAFVAPPAHLNAETALPLLRRGIHTMLEKPPGMTVAETRQLRDTAAESGAIVMVGWNRRFHPIIVKARELIEARGPIVQIVAEFHKSMTQLDTARWPDIVKDNFLLETPIHALDLLRSLAGADVSEVYPIERRVFSRYVDLHAALIIFENDCVAQFTANYTTDARLERYEIHGRDISAYLEGVNEGTVVCDGERHRLTDAGTGGTEEQNRFFINCVKHDQPITLPAANLGEAIKTMELAEKIRAGLREGE